ncbi:hypothetical protein J7J00_25335 [Bacillus sp. ISL-4]|nr:hypothetical protein [Bacillus sp. ISL-4]MBT2672986.1 hypothetical protein [Streptomyces sp. ISL-14]
MIIFKKIHSTCAIHPTDIQAGKGKKLYAGWEVNDMFVGTDFNIFVHVLSLQKRTVLIS